MTETELFPNGGRAVAFLESAGQTEALLRSPRRPGTLIALTPTAAWALESRKVPYRKAEDFYSEPALNARTDEFLDRQARCLRETDTWLRANVPQFAASGFTPAMLHFFYLKILFDALLLRAHILESIWSEMRPRQAVYFDAEEPPPGDWRLFFRGSTSLHSRCVGPWGAAHGIALDRRPFQGDERFDVPPRKRFKLALIRAKLASILRDHAALRDGRVLLWPAYDVKFVGDELMRMGIRPRSWIPFVRSLPKADPRLRLPPTPPWEDPACRAGWTELLRPEGLDLMTAARSRLDYWWKRVVPEGWAVFQAARERFRRGGIDAVVVPVIDSHRDAAVTAAARAEGVPVFVYQHGGLHGNCEYPAWEYQDLLLSDSMFFYGEGSAGHYAARLRRYPDRRSTPVPVGSARLDAIASRPEVSAIRRRLCPEGIRHSVLYFPTMHVGYQRHLSREDMPDVSHWELQRDIIRLFKRFPGTRLIYRPFEGCFESPVPALLREELPSALVMRENSLWELAWAADAVITDFPSTGLLEVLLTDRPILAYCDDRSIHMLSEARARLLPRASFDDEPAAFIRRIEDFLTAGDFSPLPHPDRGFLRAYGTHLDDGRSAERAARCITEAIGAQRPPPPASVV